MTTEPKHARCRLLGGPATARATPHGRRVRATWIWLTIAVALTATERASAQVAPIRDCTAACRLPAVRVFRLGDDPDAYLAGRPGTVGVTKDGRIIVPQFHNGITAGPPMIFDTTGHLLGHLGRIGDGPGELRKVDWIETASDDLVHVFDRARIVTYDRSLNHVSTRVQLVPVLGPRQVVMLPGGSYLAIGSEPLADLEGMSPILYRKAGGGGARTIAAERTRGLTGPWRAIEKVRDNRARIWSAQYTERFGKGYDLVQMDTSGRVIFALRREPSNWVSGDVTLRPRPAVSGVHEIREVSSGVVAVMLSQPIPEWRSIPVDPKTFAGMLDRIQTCVEAIAVSRREVLGRTCVPGVPLRLLDDHRAAVYSEDVDGVPHLDVYRITYSP